MGADLAVIVTARNEADRLGATLRALHATFPAAELWVADDGSGDATAQVATRAGARVVTAPKRLGKGGAATLAAEALLREGDPTVLLADADLGAYASELWRLVDALGPDASAADPPPAPDAPAADPPPAPDAPAADRPPGPDAPAADRPPGPDAELVADLAIATFARRAGGGFGIAVRLARWAIRRTTGRTMTAPISGQRAMRPGVLAQLQPFAHGFGMETRMTIDALRAGLNVVEVELDLEHRATGKTLGGFIHRGRQARDIARAYAGAERSKQPVTIRDDPGRAS